MDERFGIVMEYIKDDLGGIAFELEAIRMLLVKKFGMKITYKEESEGKKNNLKLSL